MLRRRQKSAIVPEEPQAFHVGHLSVGRGLLRRPSPLEGGCQARRPGKALPLRDALQPADQMGAAESLAAVACEAGMPAVIDGRSASDGKEPDCVPGFPAVLRRHAEAGAAAGRSVVDEVEPAPEAATRAAETDGGSVGHATPEQRIRVLKERVDAHERLTMKAWLTARWKSPRTSMDARAGGSIRRATGSRIRAVIPSPQDA